MVRGFKEGDTEWFKKKKKTMNNKVFKSVHMHAARTNNYIPHYWEHPKDSAILDNQLQISGKQFPQMQSRQQYLKHSNSGGIFPENQSHPAIRPCG